MIRVSVFANLLSWYNVWNLEKFILPGWSEQTCNRTIVPNPNIKEIVSSVHFSSVFFCSFSVFWWAENEISPQRSLYLCNEYSKYFRCLEYYYRDVMCRIFCFHLPFVFKANVQKCLNQIWKESSFLYLFVQCFILFIFSVLVTWKRDF